MKTLTAGHFIKEPEKTAKHISREVESWIQRPSFLEGIFHHSSPKIQETNPKVQVGSLWVDD